ncbi:flagellar protein FlaG [Humidesulfovibrio sp.]
MNINPSDTDVRQGFSLAEKATAMQFGAMAPKAADGQRSSVQTSSQPEVNEQGEAGALSDFEERSRAAAAAADKTSAKEAALRLEKHLSHTGTDLKIRILDDSQNRVQVEIVDEKSNKVLRKFPQDELLKLSASIKEMSGILLDNPA